MVRDVLYMLTATSLIVFFWRLKMVSLKSFLLDILFIIAETFLHFMFFLFG